MVRQVLDPEALARFRSYLRILAASEIDRRPQARIDPSDLVQETLLKAVRTLSQFRGTSDRTLAAWLRKILARNLANTLRGLGCAKRDVRLELALEDAFARSSAHLDALCLARERPAGAELEDCETFIQVAEAILRLPEPQGQAIVLKYLQGRSVSEIGKRLGRTDAGVAGLLRRGLASLRESLGHLR